MILQLKCMACGETLSLLRGHQGDDGGWGAVLLCREELDDLRNDLKLHRRDVCKHYKHQKQEYNLRKMSET